MKKITIFDPLNHVQLYSLGMSNVLSANQYNVTLIQNDVSGFPKVVKFVIYYYLLLKNLIVSKITNRVFIHNLPIFPLLELIIFRIFGTDNCVLVVHNSEFRHKNSKSFQQFFYNKLVFSFNKFIVHSDKTIDFVNQNNDKSPKIFKFSIPYENIENSEPINDFHYRLPKRFSLFCGLIKPYKGLSVLISAIQKNISLNSKSFTLIVAGKFSQECKIFKSDLKKLNCNVLIFDEYLPRQVLDTLIKKSEIIILPYFNIDNSGVYAQAKQFQIPSICSETGIFKEEISDGENGLLFKVGDYVDLSKKLELYWFDTFTSQKIKINCKKLTINSWENIGPKLSLWLSKF